MRAMLRRLTWRLSAWLPSKNAATVEQAWSIMYRGLDAMDYPHRDPVRRCRLLLELFGRASSANTAEPAVATGARPPLARLELLAERWERALAGNPVLVSTQDLHSRLLAYGTDLALHVVAPRAASMSASDIGAEHAGRYRITSDTFCQVIALLNEFLRGTEDNGPQPARRRSSGVLADFITGHVTTTNTRNLEDYERLFNATLEMHHTDLVETLRTATADAFHEAPVAMAVVTRQGEIVETNRVFRALLGPDRPDLVGHRLLEFVRGEDRPAVATVCQAWPGVQMAGTSSDFRLARDSREALVWVQMHWAPSTSRPGHLNIAVHDTTHYHLRHDWLVSRTRYDEVTRLPTRVQLRARLAELLAGSADSAVIGLYGVQLREIATINQTLGGAAGEEVLAALAERVVRAVSATADLVAHLDRDVLVVMVTDPASWAGADEMVRRLVDWVSRPVRTQHDYEVSLRPVVEVVQGRPGVDTAQGLLRQLDVSMHTPAGQGHRRIGAAHNERDTRRNRELARLSAAPEEGLVKVMYQPVIRPDGLIVGAHATVQWAHPQDWQFSVGDLVELADSIGLSAPVGSWLLRQVVEQAAAWEKRFGPRAPFIRVDVPDRLATDERLVEEVADARDRFGLLASDRIMLGLTERAILGEDDQPRPLLCRLQMPLVLLGFGVSVQRFDLFPVTVLRGVTVGRELAALPGGMVPSQGIKSVLPGLVNLALGLELTVCMTGIDTSNQLDHARRARATYVEGDAAGTATSAASFEALFTGELGNSRTGMYP